MSPSRVRLDSPGAGGDRSRAAALVATAACFVMIMGCGRGPDETPPYVAPQPRPGPADPSCEALAKVDKTARWGDDSLAIEIKTGGALVVADASTLGGPFAPPPRVELPPGRYPLRVLRGKTSAGEGRPLCVALVVGEGQSKTWRPEGDVIVDTDVVLLADAPHFARAAAAEFGRSYMTLEADAVDLTGLVADARDHGLELELVLPTIARATRPLSSGDRELLAGSLARHHVRGHVAVEPASLGWEAIKALGERDTARVVASGGETAVAVESGAGSGAYPVVSGRDAGGALTTVEVRLTP